MNTRIYNAKILTMTNDFEIIEGEIHIEGNLITYVGSSLDSGGLHEASFWDKEVNAEDNLILPGFKNAHTHSAMTFLRSLSDDLPLMDWLTKQIFPMEAKLVSDDVYHLSKLAILEYLTSGITSNFDMYMFPNEIAKASIDCGFRTTLTSCLHDHCQSLEELETWYLKYNNHHELINFTLGFHAEYTTSAPLLEAIAGLTAKYKAPVYTHISESAAEVEQCIKKTGMTPVCYLNSFGMFEYGGGGYHCVHLTEEDIDIFRSHSLSVITNPASNAKLASGIAPIQKLLASGINIAIGTDGPASNNCLDMFREMFLVTALAKLREKDAAAVDAMQVLDMACVGGAKAMRLFHCDTLEKGKLADLIMIDLQQPNMQPLNHIPKNLVYAGSKLNVKLTMVNGVILYENGTFHINTDPKEIYAKANEIIHRYL